MTDRTPVLLSVLIHSPEYRWHVAGIGLEGSLTPLLRSDPGNLDEYAALPPDEQLSFIRHRLSGVLQRGCDRLWGRDEKPCHIVLIANEPFANGSDGLTQRVADHFVDWMAKPPVAFFIWNRLFDESDPAQSTDAIPDPIAGEISDEQRAALRTALSSLSQHVADPAAWEHVPTRREA